MGQGTDSTTTAGGASPIDERRGEQPGNVQAMGTVRCQVSTFRELANEIVGKCIATSEREVMAAGDAVRAIYDETRDQVSAMDTAVASLGKGSGKHSGASLGAAMSRQSEMFAEFMHQLAKRLEAQSTAATQAVAMVARVHEFTKKVSNLWSAARILTVNARIEAAHLGEQGAGFTVIAQEMADFTLAVGKANEATAGIAQQIADTIPAIASEAEAMVSAARAFSDRLADESGRLEHTYSAAMGGALDALSTASVAAKKTVERAQEVLSHLQFQDMLTQALRQIEELSKTLDANVEGMAAGRLSSEQVASLSVKSVFDDEENEQSARGDVLLF
jgi:methyl-accepting chemotaxis protein